MESRILNSVRLESQSRVMVYCQQRDVIALSQENANALWPGFGVRLISTKAENFSILQPVHKKEMRDMAFHPQSSDLLLTVSLDQFVKVTEITSNKVN